MGDDENLRDDENEETPEDPDEILLGGKKPKKEGDEDSLDELADEEIGDTADDAYDDVDEL